MAEAFTLLAYSAAAAGVNATLAALPAIADPHVRVVGNGIYVPADFHFTWGATGIGPTITRAQLVSPSLRRTFLHEVAPLDFGAALPASPRKIYLFDDQPLPLDPGEELDVSITNTASDRETVLVWLAGGASKPIDKPCFSLRVTATPTAVTGQWTNGAITFDQSLPAGRYQLVGARFRSTNLIAFRFLFIGGTYRPGAIGYAATTSLDYDKFRQGNLGVWGEFAHNAPPTVDFLANAADASFTGELDLVYLGPGGAVQ
jgi:hypothetical protein